ncbi:spore coat protein [Prauserella muralis]|uniref:Spore coat protein n=1 Tax=Prauserella muralis TaxID=588067 RepID=A0A2V4B9Y6_9PSEU|nr:spore coat protein [Prauserella muralis]PXY31871.1 spore coat protein [Prauserella muralis]TWE13713.1 spore coat polysaccharide biosynthesis predicted glycosyltransferase SpsG [Prauserella muralis]
MTRLLLRADGSGSIGIGHVARAVAFAEEACERGWDVTFSGLLDGADWFADRLGELGVRHLPPADEAALGQLAADVDAVLVDHYDLGELRQPLNRAGAALVSLEGGTFGRRAADIVVDAGLHGEPRPPDGSPVVLSGPRFAPLRRAVVDAREQRQPGSGPPRVVVVVGGGALWRDTVTGLLRALRDTGLPFTADVLAHGEPELPEPAPGQRFQLAKPDTELPKRLAATDLAVSAAGVTLLELCCVGVPAALVCLVDNQRAGYLAAVERGLAAGLGTAGELAASPAHATGVLARLLADRVARERMAADAAATVDGRGAARVLDAVEDVLR